MNMKVSFNPAIKYNYFKKGSPTAKREILSSQKMPMIGALDCLYNYNVPFCARPIYAISYEGDYEKFSSAAAAAKKYNGNGVYEVLSGKRCSSSANKTYAYAEQIELPNGEVNFNAINKALLAFRDASNQPIYSIDYEGNIQRFDTPVAASKTLNVNPTYIYRVLSEETETASGYIFVKAFDVELRNKEGKLLKDENGNPAVDMDVLNKLRERFLYMGKRFPIIRIDKNGSIKRYKSINEAIIDLNTKRMNIKQSLLNSRVTQGKYTFAKLSDVVEFDEFGDVLFDENNDYKIDYDKIEKIRKIVFEK